MYNSRIRTRAAGMPNGTNLLAIASRPPIREDMRQRVGAGEKPVTALSEPMVQAFGEAAAKNDSLRRLAGEVAAHIVETDYLCVRASGSRIITGDKVFTSGQPFRLPSAAKRVSPEQAEQKTNIEVPEFLARYLTNEALRLIADVVASERERREVI